LLEEAEQRESLLILDSAGYSKLRQAYGMKLGTAGSLKNSAKANLIPVADKM
jgi:hypothetical protein